MLALTAPTTKHQCAGTSALCLSNAENLSQPSELVKRRRGRRSAKTVDLASARPVPSSSLEKFTSSSTVSSVSKIAGRHCGATASILTMLSITCCRLHRPVRMPFLLRRYLAQPLLHLRGMRLSLATGIETSRLLHARLLHPSGLRLCLLPRHKPRSQPATLHRQRLRNRGA